MVGQNVEKTKIDKFLGTNDAFYLQIKAFFLFTRQENTQYFTYPVFLIHFKININNNNITLQQKYIKILLIKYDLY